MDLFGSEAQAIDAMQGIEEQEPTVRIRSLKRDRVNFVLENVNLAYVRSVYLYLNRA